MIVAHGGWLVCLFHAHGLTQTHCCGQVAAEEAELREAVEEERALLLLAFTLFRDVLASGHAALETARSAATAAATAAAEAAADEAVAGLDRGANGAAAVGDTADAAAPAGGGAAAMASASARTAAEAAERQAWFTFTLASLRAFARRYGAAAAPLIGQLEGEIFGEGISVPSGVREAVHEGLHL